MNKYLQNVFRSLLCAIAIGLSLTPAFAYFCIWQWISPETNIEKILMIFMKYQLNIMIITGMKL